MQNVWVLTPEPLPKSTLQELIQSWGGYWDDEPTLDQGVIERGSAALYISLGDRITPHYYESEKLEEIRRTMGRNPKNVIDIHIGHGKGSRTLAREFATAAVDRWGGYFDRNQQDI